MYIGMCIVNMYMYRCIRTHHTESVYTLAQALTMSVPFSIPKARDCTEGVRSGVMHRMRFMMKQLDAAHHTEATAPPAAATRAQAAGHPAWVIDWLTAADAADAAQATGPAQNPPAQVTGSRALQRIATEHSRGANYPPPNSSPEADFAQRRSTTEHSSARSCRLDPDIRLQKSTTPIAVRIKRHHDRTPDVGIGILISIPSYRAGEEYPEMIEYYGEHCGQGQSKTVFDLNCPGARFHGKVLKVAKANDMEPSVFMKAAQVGLTTSILYNCVGVDADSGRCFHCWITDRTIPLDEFCRDDNAIKSRCSLAAFCCLLRAALYGLHLSDCRFFNFGVRLTESITEHLVVIIDAGSRGIHRDTPWKKSKINTTVMHRFWKACAEVSATNLEIQNLWKDPYTENIEKCLKIATDSWHSWPFLTKSQESTCAIRQAMIAKDSFRRSVAHSKSAYKIMELVGRFAAEDQWSAACALACYRASEELRSKLFSEEYNILDELYERIIHTRARDEELHDVMMVWGRLHEYRKRECCRLLQSSEEQSVTPEQASAMLDSFKYNQLWYDLTWEQQQSKGWRSTLNTILHHRAGWTHAARAIMEYGLPKLEQRPQPDDAAEHINALGQFARDMAEWLLNFASRMHAYRQTADYQKNYQTSIEAIKKRKRSM